MTLLEIAKNAFLTGSDCFGAKPKDYIKEIEYSVFMKQYCVYLDVVDRDGEEGTTMVGFRKSPLGGYDVYSGGKVFSIDSTPELEKEFKGVAEVDY